MPPGKSQVPGFNKLRHPQECRAGEQKGESFVTENPKGGIAENFGRVRGRGGNSKLLAK